MKKLSRPLFIALGLFVIFIVAFSEILLLSSANSDYNKTLATANLDTLREDAGILSSALSPNSSVDIDQPYTKFLDDLDAFSKNPPNTFEQRMTLITPPIPIGRKNSAFLTKFLNGLAKNEISRS